MKNPRVDDFDPNAAAKPLASPMDNFPVIEKPAPTVPTPPPNEPTVDVPATAVPPKPAHNTSREFIPTQMRARMHAYVQTALNERAPYSYTFRYPPSVLEAIDATLDLIQRRFRRKLHKNAIPVLALAFLLWDFEANDTESILYQELVLKQG